MSEAVQVAVGERRVRLSNLDKVLYPLVGFTKAEVVDYYARTAEYMLPHLKGRCVTFRRWPDGVAQKSFFEKNCPGHRPSWLATSVGPGGEKIAGESGGQGAGSIEYCRLEEPAALVWSANLAALELHTPMALAADLETPTMVVFDLDPGEPATITECAQVAWELRDILAAVDLSAWAKTSGSKGLQIYVPVNGDATHQRASQFALAVGKLLAKRLPKLVLVEMSKSLRSGKVLVDWSQNSRHKTTIAPYSLRGRPEPTVSTPITWDEVGEAAEGKPMTFRAAEVIERVAKMGDLFSPTLSKIQSLPTIN